jgi:hypothetical protein
VANSHPATGITLIGRFRRNSGAAEIGRRGGVVVRFSQVLKLLKRHNEPLAKSVTYRENKTSPPNKQPIARSPAQPIRTPISDRRPIARP